MHMDGGGGIDPDTNLPTLPGEGTYFYDDAVDANFYGANGVPSRKSMIAFDGTGYYFSIAASPQWDLTTTAATFETWVYFNSLPVSTNQGIIDQYTDNTSVTGNYRLGIAVDDQGDGIDVHLANSWLLNSGVDSITPGKWFHIAITWTGDPAASNNFKFWLNGVNVDTATAGYGPDCSNGVTWIGRWDTKYLDGIMDQYRISNTVRYTSTFTPPGPFTTDANTILPVSYTHLRAHET